MRGHVLTRGTLVLPLDVRTPVTIDHDGPCEDTKDANPLSASFRASLVVEDRRDVAFPRRRFLLWAV